MEKTYWAAEKDDDKFIKEVMDRVTEYHDFLQDSNLYWVWARSYVAYYGANLTNYDIGRMFAGMRMDVENNTIRAKVNHYRNLIKHALQLITSQRPALSCRATNTDIKSQSQSILGAGLVDYYIREKTYAKHFSRAAEYGMVLSEGWIHSPWRKDIGDLYIKAPADNDNEDDDTFDDLPENLRGILNDPDGDNEEISPREEKIYQGDVDPKVHSPLAIIRDVTLEHDEQQWRIVEEFENKWDLAAEWAKDDKELYEHIINLSTEDMFSSTSGAVHRFNWYLANKSTSRSDDHIKTYTFYHDPSPAMPEGRVVKLIDGAILQDVDMPYERMPLTCVKPDEILDSPFGYTPAFEILGPQQGIDALNSAIVTNVLTGAKQKIWTKTGDSIQHSNLGGDSILHLQSKSKPEALNFTNSSPEAYKMVDYFERSSEVMIGISSTVRGKPEANLNSGAALALVVSQSISFSSIYEQSYNFMIEKEGTDLIEKLRIFAKTPRVAAILGESSRPFQKQFTADDLSEINRVVVDQQSALSKTTAGKIQLADSLLEKGLIENAKQYIMVITTGQLDPAIQNTQYELLNVRGENEEMRNGNTVMAIITENPMTHIKEHRALLENPDAKKDPELIKIVTEHIQEHIDLWVSMPPALMMLLGIEPPPQGSSQIPSPIQPNGAQATDRSPATVMNRSNSGPVPSDMMPDQPSMPTNPVSGEEFNNETGGL